MPDRLYVSGLWHVSENKKRDASHYQNLLPGTLELLAGSKLIFYTDIVEVRDQVASLANRQRIDVEFKDVSIRHLPAWKHSQDAVEACQLMALDLIPRPSSFGREKGTIHYWRDLKGSGADAYRKILAIWLSKVALTTRAAEVAQQESVAWVDASVSRFNKKRKKWNFTKDAGSSHQVSHFGSNMNFYGDRLPLNASYLEAHPSTWAQVEKMYSDMSVHALQMPYGHEEETILGQCVKAHPQMFRRIDGNLQPTWRMWRQSILKKPANTAGTRGRTRTGTPCGGGF